MTKSPCFEQLKRTMKIEDLFMEIMAHTHRDELINLILDQLEDDLEA